MLPYLRFLFIVFATSFIFSGCMDRMVCPAFQSTYILDDSLRFAYFSPLWKLDKLTRDAYISEHYGANSGQDLTKYFEEVSSYVRAPEVTHRTKYGVVRYQPEWLRNHELMSAPREDLTWKVAADTAAPSPVDIGDFVASDYGLDSLVGDDLLIASEDMDTDDPKPVSYLYKFDPNGKNNVEQLYYNKYFGNLLVSNTESTDSEMTSDSTALKFESDTTDIKKKGFLKLNKKESNEETVVEDEKSTGQ